MEQLQVKAASEYFKGKKGFQSLFTQFVKKYRSLGRIGGFVTIKNATDTEKRDIGGFLGEDFSKEIDIKISMTKFEKALEETKFRGTSLIGILEEYTGTKVISNKEKSELKEKEQQAFLQGFLEQSCNELQRIWIASIQEKKKGTQQIYNLYTQDKKRLKEAFSYVFKALKQLPLAEYQRLPIFSSSITSDPHYFDIGEYGGKLLVGALQVILNKTNEKELIVSPNAEQITEILDCFGIMRDDVNNYVIAYGLQGFDEKGEEDTLLEVAYKQNRVLNLPLRELHKLNKINAIHNEIFVVENSGLFSSLVDMLIEKNIKASVICSNGQMRLATLLLFKKSNAKIYYSGDYDPEGILMAKGLKNKFGERVHYWRFAEEDYLHSMSEIVMDGSRISKLNNIKDKELSPLIRALQVHKKSGYQEEQIHNLFQDIAKKYIS